MDNKNKINYKLWRHLILTFDRLLQLAIFVWVVKVVEEILIKWK